jgi:hypothetical protein
MHELPDSLDASLQAAMKSNMSCVDHTQHWHLAGIPLMVEGYQNTHNQLRYAWCTVSGAGAAGLKLLSVWKLQRVNATYRKTLKVDVE